MPPLEGIRANLGDRLQEAKDQGWLGEVAHDRDHPRSRRPAKLNAMRDLTTKRISIHLGMPHVRPTAGRCSPDSSCSPDCTSLREEGRELNALNCRIEYVARPHAYALTGIITRVRGFAMILRDYDDGVVVSSGVNQTDSGAVRCLSPHAGLRTPPSPAMSDAAGLRADRSSEGHVLARQACQPEEPLTGGRT